jgi:hypothetical protein
MTHIFVLFASLFLLSSACAHQASIPATESRLKTGGLKYSVLVHSPELKPLVSDQYSLKDLSRLEIFLEPSLKIAVNSRGLVQAADRELGGEKDSTNYDAVWLRDSLWVYLGLKSARSPQSSIVLKTMLDYLASEPQLRRLANIVGNPDLATRAGGNMEVIHIRFDGRSNDFNDVIVNGKPQEWNHRQNDATGLFYDLILRALNSGEIPVASLNQNHLRLLTALPCYFDKLKFYQMEDAGPWEEIDRVNTSSISLVTSALENLQGILAMPSPFSRELRTAASRLNQSQCLSTPLLTRLIGGGYDRIHKQLSAGGESPLYPLASAKYRRADAALLNAIYPAQLKRLTYNDKLAILQIIQPLIGQVGIKRYLFDSYQSGNFWQQQEANTDDTSSSESFNDRGSRFIPDTEAQWFFDSWISVAYAQLFREKKEPGLYEKQVAHFNRALGQLTGGALGDKVMAADGKPVPSRALPESYNQLVEGDNRKFSPSPITPLNWAKASLRLSLEEMKSSVRY